MSMNLPTYDVDAKAEGSWLAVATATGTLVGAVLAALGVEATVVAAAASLSGALVRIIVGHLLPSSGA